MNLAPIDAAKYRFLANRQLLPNEPILNCHTNLTGTMSEFEFLGRLTIFRTEKASPFRN
jgi:hypothetical protein